MLRTASIVTACALSLSCAAAPTAPPVGPSADQELSRENRQLRERVTELEGELKESETTHSGELAQLQDALAEVRDRNSELEEKERAAKPRTFGPAKGVVHSVPIDDGIVVGRSDALVTMVVATEAACLFCWRAEDTMAALRKQYGRDLRVVYMHRIVHRHVAEIPARAFCAAGLQRKGPQMWSALRKLFETHKTSKFTRADMLDAAAKLRLNKRRFEQALDGRCADIVAKHDKQMTDLKAMGTPTFFINGEVINGARDISEFRTLIDRKLQEAREMVNNGVSRRSLYPAIVGLGVKPAPAAPAAPATP